MAKQAGPYKVIGCIDNLQFYKMDGKYYARKKSSLTAKRVKKDKAFELTMAFADMLGIASKIASSVYRQIPGEERKHSYFRKMTGIAYSLLKEGVSIEKVYEKLCHQTFPAEPEVNVGKQLISPLSFADEVLKNIFSVPLIEKKVEEYIGMATITNPP